MKLDPSLTPEEIVSLLQERAERVYGPDRANVMAEQMEHLSRMLAEIARREMELTDPGPAQGDDR